MNHFPLTVTWLRAGFAATILCFVVIGILAWEDSDHLFMTADQKGQRLLSQGKPLEAAEAFSDTNRKALAYFEAGEFKEAASLLAGIPGPDASYNHGNALLMSGKYAQAATRYERALQLRPDWEAAEINRSIALARAKLLETEGGEMTGGMLEADGFVFNDKPSGEAGDEVITEGGEASDKSVQEMWLKQVQTTPSQFLSAKFSYQVAKRQADKNP